MKTIGDYTYVHISNLNELPSDLYEKVVLAKEMFGPYKGSFQVVKVSKKLARVSLLCYPRFWKQQFPELVKSWLVKLDEGTVEVRTYNKDNPPILHRKELFINQNHPDIEEMRKITATCEAAGLFADTKRIGYRKYWRELMAEKGVTL